MISICAALAIGLSRQASATHEGMPAIPATAREGEKKDLQAIVQDLATNRFADAQKSLAGWMLPPSPKVFFDWLPVAEGLRTGYTAACENAVKAWNDALGGSPRFSIVAKPADADIFVFFDRNVLVQDSRNALICDDVAFQKQTNSRKAEIHLSLLVPYFGVIHQPRSIEHMMARALGSYLGLAETSDFNSVMGQDSHQPVVAVKPSAAEAADVKALETVRARLARAIKDKVVLDMPMAKIEFESIRQNAGEVWRGDVAHYNFRFKNSGKAPLEITATPGCGCTVAKYDKVIPPGASSVIEADLKTENYRAEVIKSIDVTTNDPLTPKVTLLIEANVKSGIVVLPTETPLISLNETGATTQEMEIQTVDDSDLTGVTCSWPYVTPKLEPEAGKPHAYKLTLLIGDAAPRGRNVFSTTVESTSKRIPHLTFTSVTEKGIIIQPPTVFFGPIDAKKLPPAQFITFTRRTGAFHVLGVQCDDQDLEVKLEPVKDGQEYRVNVAYKGGWPNGPINRKIVVTTDDPNQARLEISVYANVSSGK